ncbi:MAG TPA: GNAT family protein, partial [Acidimicrobiales bacterium]
QPRMTPLTLSDGHVVLRTPEERDAPAVTACVRESLDSLSRWLTWASADYDEAAALRWIRRQRDPTEVAFLIEENGTIAGSCGLNRVDRANQNANLGYWLRPDHTGRGLATRAARLVARHGLTTLGLHRIEIVMAVDNDASRRVAERLGAVHEGTLRGRLWLHGRFHDMHMYSLLASDLA